MAKGVSDLLGKRQYKNALAAMQGMAVYMLVFSNRPW